MRFFNCFYMLKFYVPIVIPKRIHSSKRSRRKLFLILLTFWLWTQNWKLLDSFVCHTNYFILLVSGMCGPTVFQCMKQILDFFRSLQKKQKKLNGDFEVRNSVSKFRKNDQNESISKPVLAFDEHRSSNAEAESSASSKTQCSSKFRSFLMAILRKKWNLYFWRKKFFIKEIPQNY